MKRQRLILLLLLASVTGLLLCQVIRDPREQTWALADGSRLVFLGTTVGTNHVRSYGGLLQQMIARLPASLRDRFADTTLIRANQGGQTNAVFWFRVRKNLALKEFVYIQPTANGGARALFRFKFKDDQGQNHSNPSWVHRHQLPSGDYAYVAWATNFPSTSRKVHLWLYGQPVPPEEAQPVEFDAPNPLYQEQL